MKTGSSLAEEEDRRPQGSRFWLTISALLFYPLAFVLAWQVAAASLQYAESLAPGDEGNATTSLLAGSDERLADALGEYYASLRKIEDLVPQTAVIVRENPGKVFGSDAETLALHVFALQLRHLLYPRMLRDLPDPVAAADSISGDLDQSYYLLRMQRGRRPLPDSRWQLVHSDKHCELYLLGGG